MLPWAEMFRSALSVGLSPREFWALSLKEWRWLAAGNGTPFNPEHLHELMKEYPDG